MIKDIIPTLTIYNDIKKSEEYEKSYFELGISTIRVNMTQFDNQTYINELNMLQSAYSKISAVSKLRFMLDLPILSKNLECFEVLESVIKIKKFIISNILKNEAIIC